MQIWSSVAVLGAAIAGAAQARNLTANFDVLAYNDVYEMLQDEVDGLNLGGPSRVVPLAKAMRAANPNSLVLFAGDTVSPSLWSTQFNGLHMVEAHNAITLDFASLGNHEFDFGLDNFMNVSLASNFPWLNANCYELDSGELLRGTVPNAVKNLSDPVNGDISIGLFGVMYDMQDSSKGLYWEDPIDAAKVQVAALQAKGVDFIIALTHQDLADDNTFSNEVEGVDLIYAGHDHTSMLQTNFGTPYLKADFDFRSIWTSHIEYYAADDDNDRTSLMTHRAIPITESMPTDPALDEIIAGYEAQMAELEKEIIGTLCEDLDLSQQLVRTADCKIGHLFSNAALQFYGNGSADVAVMNGGGIRTDSVVPAGNLSLGELLSWSPFGNMLQTIETNGASLKLYIKYEMLASCGANVIQQNGFYVHPAGFNYTFTCTGEETGEVTSLNWFEHPTRSGEIQDSDEFVMAISNYLYSSEFLKTDGVTSTVVVSEAEASRVDAALEAYVASLPDNNVCLDDEVRSSVSF